MTKISDIKDPTRRIFEFARERHAIYLRRQQMAMPPPWTKDEILANYRFCCVYRELDRVTQWIAQNWRDPHASDKDLWFAMCVARLFNQPETLEALGYPNSWDERTKLGVSYRVDFLRVLRRRRENKEIIFNAAYIVSTNGIEKNKVLYLAENVLDPLWAARERLRPRPGDTLNSWHMLLGQMQGFGSFMTAQVIADLKYATGSPLAEASDWRTFAASGPGSRRGLNYLLGRERKAPWTEEEWRMEALRLRDRLLPLFEKARMPEPHAQDVQNLLCEWSKYWMAATEGKMPKQRYRVS